MFLSFKRINVCKRCSIKARANRGQVVQEIEKETEREIQTNFSGIIGIYTLIETAAIRARQFLRKLLPNARVEINADMASTDRLKHLASNADIFVFAWRSSKYQAYYAVKDARGDRNTLLPLGNPFCRFCSPQFQYFRKYFYPFQTSNWF